MPHEFEVREEITLDATPEQVWEAIATGPGIDSWFMGRNEIEPRLGGKVTMSLPGFSMESRVTAWEPGRRLATRGEENPDGTFMAFEYLIEGREGGSTVLRFVHNGFLGDDWEAEYDALKVGDRMYLLKLAQYVKYFPGRTATYAMFAPGPQVPVSDRVWSAYASALGLSDIGTVAEGDRVRIAIDGLPPTDGVVAFVNLPIYLGVRTDDGLYTFMHGFQDGTVVEHHNFSKDVDSKQIEQSWQSWIERSLA
jgi:uncharacterized protein YndB with AHSA1/START domain